MSTRSPALFVLVAAMLVNAALVAWVALSPDPTRRRSPVELMVIGVVLLALVVALAWRPTALTLSLARGVALIALIVTVSLAVVYYVVGIAPALNNKPSASGLVAVTLAGVAIQAAILVSASLVDRRPVLEAVISTIGTAIVLYLVGAAAFIALDFVRDFL